MVGQVTALDGFMSPAECGQIVDLCNTIGFNDTVLAGVPSLPVLQLLMLWCAGSASEGTKLKLPAKVTPHSTISHSTADRSLSGAADCGTRIRCRVILALP